MYSERELKRKQIQLLSAQGLPLKDITQKLEVNFRTAKKWSKTDDYQHHYNTIQEKKLTPNTKKRISGQMNGVIGASLRKCTKALNMSDDYIKRKKNFNVFSE